MRVLACFFLGQGFGEVLHPEHLMHDLGQEGLFMSILAAGLHHRMWVVAYVGAVSASVADVCALTPTPHNLHGFGPRGRVAAR